jgi:tetratricopeptide (TPR) repeat protein
MASNVAEASYPDVFQRHVVRGAKAARRRLEQSKGLLLGETRDLALQALHYALSLECAWHEARSLVLALVEPMEQAGFREEWAPYLQRGLEQSRCYGDGEAEAELHFALGTLDQYGGRFPEARQHYQASERLFAAIDPYRQARALNRLAYVARLQRQPEEARQIADQARALVVDDSLEAAYSALVYGTTAFDSRDWAGAKEWLERSLTIYEQHGEARSIARGLTNLAPAYQWLGESEAAIRCCERAIRIFEEIQDPVNLATARMNLAIVFFNQGRAAEALAQNGLAEPIYRETQDRVRLAVLLNNIGMAAQKLGVLERAAQAFEESVALWQALGTVSAAINTMDNLALAYLAQGRGREAVAVLEQALAQLEQVADEANRAHLAAMVRGHLAEATAALAPSE